MLVVDGHQLIAESVAGLLPQLGEVREAKSATSVSLARAIVRAGPVDVVLVDDVLHGESGLELLRATSHGGRRPLVVIFSSGTDPARVAGALRAGAAGWLAKDCELAELSAALDRVRSGMRWISPGLRAGVIEELLERGVPASMAGDDMSLPPRRRQVLACLVEGKSHGETAVELGLSLSTVRTHVRDLCRMAGVHSTPALVALVRAGRLKVADDTFPRPR